MRRVFTGIMSVVLIAVGARLFWLKEFAEPFRLTETLITLVVFIFAFGIFIATAKARKPAAAGLAKSAPEPRHEGPAAAQPPAHDTPAAVVPVPVTNLKQAPAPPFDINNLLAEFEALPGEDTRAETVPAWALIVRSPFAKADSATSWFGGRPHAPAGFDWPAGDTGQPCNFVAQIDLAAMGQGPRPAGIPDTGAMLIFITGAQSRRAEYVVRFLGPEDMALARAVDTPADTASLVDLGFYNATQTFPEWPVDLVPFDDVREQDPPFDAPEPAQPEDWLTTWGLAAFEAKLALDALNQDARLREAFYEWEKRPHSTPVPDFKLREGQHHRQMEQVAPALQAALQDFIAQAEKNPPAAGVDRTALSQIVHHRQTVRDLCGPFALKARLLPDAALSERYLLDRFMRGKGPDWAQDVPPAFHAFLSSRITGWRQHRLFGRTLPPQTSPDDLRGLDTLISIGPDPLLATLSEHEDGFSVWCDRNETARGNWQAGKVVWHTNV